ncbi:MAG: DNA polymerase III subunit delta' [Candidatus Omnitrophota bacterium]
MIKSEIIINENILQRFRLLNERGWLAHAYLFIGPKGCGKSETALEVAKLVNCESRQNSGCQCEPCRKIDAGNHPDLTIVDHGEDQSIKIHKIRDLIQKIQLLPYEGKKKVLILKDIDLLTPESANALLKTLEEPTSSSLFLLTTSVPERVFETIRSRCHSVHFFGCSREDILKQLKNRTRISQEQGEVIAGFAEGCFGKACRMQEEDFVTYKNGVIDQFLSKGMDERFFKSITGDNEKVKDALAILFFCFKDMLLLKTNVPGQRLTNNDRRDELAAYSAHRSMGRLQEILASVVETKKMLDAGLNIKIPLMLLKEKIWSNT